MRIERPGPPSNLRLQVAADSAFERIVNDQRREPGKAVRIAGLDDAQWFLRARRIDDQGIEGYDAVRPFVLKARPEPPAYRAPRADAKQTVGAVEFSWARNSLAPQVRLQLAEDAGFTRLLQDRDGVTDSTLRTDLKAAGVDFWRLASVRADADHGPFGEAQRFELRPTPEPPAGGLAADGRSLVFKWSGRPQDRQEVQLARDLGFTQITAQAPRWNQPSGGCRHRPAVAATTSATAASKPTVSSVRSATRRRSTSRPTGHRFGCWRRCCCSEPMTGQLLHEPVEALGIELFGRVRIGGHAVGARQFA